jgi:uncharacterized membrane protein
MQTDRGADRLVAFSDAVVAIAITLVVLPLVDTGRDSGQDNIAHFVTENASALAAAALTFVVIANMWMAHHTAFQRFTRLTPGMVRMNFVWLAAIVFLPLPTVLVVAAGSEDRFGLGLYIGTMLAGMVALAVIDELAPRAAREGDAERRGPASSALSRWLPAGLMGLALVLAVAVPAVGLWGLLVLVVAIPAQHAMRRPIHTTRT